MLNRYLYRNAVKMANKMLPYSLRHKIRDVIKNIEIVKNMDQLDEKLKQVDKASAISDEAMRKVFQSFRMKFQTNLPADPWSDDYKKKQFEIYEVLSGKSYDVKYEVSKIEVREASNIPFPYMTKSCETVGTHLMGIGYLIKTMNIPPSSKILEFGPGWGNTTEALARMGHDVTAVDIEKNFIDIINERSRKLSLNIKTVCDDFAYAGNVKEPFDVVLFFECFHHASDHVALIKNLDRALKDNGIVVFAAEPIEKDFPIPWGLRMDGESLWAIRKNGWLELGFRESYFIKTLKRHGWETIKYICEEIPSFKIYIAKKIENKKVP
jgi:2-polyprenyl-3-methyl-5-hydroxy-6-metoxy-1,4-benzoquinol methylase